MEMDSQEWVEKIEASSYVRLWLAYLRMGACRLDWIEMLIKMI